MALALTFFMTIAASAANLPAEIATSNGNLDLASAKPTVVVFLSSRCPCSHAHEASLKTLATEYSKQGFRFVGVHANADEQTAADSEKLKTSDLNFPIVSDKSTALANAFGALKTPHVYVVKANKVIYQGGVDDSADPATAKKFYLKDTLAALAAGKNPEIAQTRTMGCIIKRN